MRYLITIKVCWLKLSTLRCVDYNRDPRAFLFAINSPSTDRKVQTGQTSRNRR